MAIIKPFKGIRPPQELVEQVASRPYDVLNSQEAREEAAGNEKSLYRIIKPEIDFPVGTDEHDERVYAKAAENFRMFQDKGWLVQDGKENYYIYAQTMNGKTQYGLVVGAYVPDYLNGSIKKHELTRRDKEEDRMKHVRVNNANIEPVFFAYPDSAVLDVIVKKYTLNLRFMTLLLPVTVSDTPSGLSISKPILPRLQLSLPKCRLSILRTDITVLRLPHWLVPRKPSKTRIIKATKSITTSWLYVSLPTS
ncbi:hypothetical protein JCM10512_3972 [Bacteroides reticulotermitis JCM 10512]|uniref:DUF1015 domain-containing protein n=1 Tax=Bacteroides reticulotermitis JCM 10512 TaxID=1445607 RepID=W4UY65_9BACE|nr:hypothetical protein JCM10512_3972 [Bacteroides reticulotermitis JCM 10512]